MFKSDRSRVEIVTRDFKRSLKMLAETYHAVSLDPSKELLKDLQDAKDTVEKVFQEMKEAERVSEVARRSKEETGRAQSSHAEDFFKPIWKSKLQGVVKNIKAGLSQQSVEDLKLIDELVSRVCENSGNTDISLGDKVIMSLNIDYDTAKALSRSKGQPFAEMDITYSLHPQDGGVILILNFKKLV
jgi:hypothetical protein